MYGTKFNILIKYKEPEDWQAATANPIYLWCSTPAIANLPPQTAQSSHTNAYKYVGA